MSVISRTIAINAFRRSTSLKKRFGMTAEPAKDDVSLKPPNILVHCGDKEWEEKLKCLIKETINPLKYVVYNVSGPDLKTAPWNENTTLLVLQGMPFDLGAISRVNQYCRENGSLLLVGNACFSNFTDHMKPVFEDTVFTTTGTNRIVKLDRICRDSMRETLSAHFGIEVQDNDKNPDVNYTSAALMGSSKAVQDFLLKIAARCDQTRSFKQGFLNIRLCSEEPTLSASSSLMPLKITNQWPAFDYDRYRETLSSKYVGHLVIHCPVISTSFAPLEGTPLISGLAVIPDQQMSGKGRSGNAWLSPPGCCMFSLQLHAAMTSPLGRHMPLIQHMIALAFVHAVRTAPNLSSFDVRLKWPNDVYFGRTIKLGGVLAYSSVFKDRLVCNIGMGVNLDNGDPTVCINDLLREHGYSEKIHREVILARTFSIFEELLERLQKEDIDSIRELYYKYWLHSEQTVTVQRENHDETETMVVGIDSYGFLKVKDKKGNVFTVQPDGNSFDMMKGLVYPKMSR